ncbi:hypothetical protein GCM10010103_41630 [Streptomyces paradoxus]
MLVGETDKRVVFRVRRDPGSPMRANSAKWGAERGSDPVKAEFRAGYQGLAAGLPPGRAGDFAAAGN